MSAPGQAAARACCCTRECTHCSTLSHALIPRLEVRHSGSSRAGGGFLSRAGGLCDGQQQQQQLGCTEGSAGSGCSGVRALTAMHAHPTRLRMFARVSALVCTRKTVWHQRSTAALPCRIACRCCCRRRRSRRRRCRLLQALQHVQVYSSSSSSRLL